MLNPNNSQSLEKYSSALTLSDMEIFIFPELLYALVLANMMSDKIWKWKKDPWFNNINKMNELKRINRLKQYVMDHFAFNLDLDTWGLTSKQKELKRFKDFLDERIIAESNALFGYEGDKYYFDIDIRRHFGLDKYNSDIIPYWKTESVEAMEAFKHKEGYSTGAGECVSLVTLYAAAAFIVAEIPLDKIYLLTTPLHSQNFLDIGDGIITNNRRIITKKMWFNGTELSAKARRALENENVTIVAHRSGYIHTVYPQASISKDFYLDFKDKITKYLSTPITFEILSNFLRHNSKLQCCFQIAHLCCGKPRYIEAEKVYHYEHSSKARVGDATQKILLHEIEEDEFYPEPIRGRLILSEVEKFFRKEPLPVDEEETVKKLKSFLKQECYKVDVVVKDLIKFCRTIPKLPDYSEKEWLNDKKEINLEGVSSREEVIERLKNIRESNPVADIAFYAYRDINLSHWKPFFKAALERNPVSIEGVKKLDINEIYNILNTFSSESIYNGESRLALPDEVWNYKRGDGLEKAILFMNVLHNRYPQDEINITFENKSIVVIKFKDKNFQFTTDKKVKLPLKEDYLF